MIGASVLTRGGLHQGFEFAASCRCESLQMYVAPSRTWNVPLLTGSDIERFNEFRNTFGYQSGIVVAHASLLINLASSDEALRRRSVDRAVIEIRRASTLGVDRIVIHPGSNPDSVAGMALIVQSLREILSATAAVSVLVETVAGQGNSIGWKFEQIRQILDRTGFDGRMGVCFDTCHVFAAGYDVAGIAGYAKTMSEFDRIIGTNRIGAFHVNDSKTPLGSRVDRHAPLIGGGHIGPGAFHALLHDVRFRAIPMIAEVPDSEHLTEINVARLRELRESDVVDDENSSTRSLFS